MTAAHDYEEMHQLIDRLTPDQLGEVRAHALRLAAGRKRFVPWDQACATASSLPKVDYEQFRSDIDDAVVQDFCWATTGEDQPQRPPRHFSGN